MLQTELLMEMGSFFEYNSIFKGGSKNEER